MQDGDFDLSVPEVALGLITAAVAYFVPPLALLPGAIFIGVILYRMDPAHWQQAGQKLLDATPDQHLLPARQSAAADQPPASAQAGADLHPLLPALAQSPCLIIAGGRGSGKTELLKHLVGQRGGLVIDPHASPTKWGDVRVVGAGGRYDQIDLVLEWLVLTMRSRLHQIGTGEVAEGDHKPLPVFVDEWRAIRKNLPSAPDKLGDLLTEARKVNIDLVVASPSAQVKTLGFEGEGDLREGFDIVQLNRRTRTATVDMGEGPEPYALPPIYQRPPPKPKPKPKQDDRATLKQMLATNNGIDISTPGVSINTGINTGISKTPDTDAPNERYQHAPDMDAIRTVRRRRGQHLRPKNRSSGGIPDMGAVSGKLSEDDKIRRMLMVPMGTNEIVRAIGGNRNRIVEKIQQLKTEMK